MKVDKNTNANDSYAMSLTRNLRQMSLLYFIWFLPKEGKGVI